MISTNVPRMADEETPNQSPGKKLSSVLLKILPVVVITAVAVGGAIFFVRSKPEVLGLSKNQAASTEEVDTLLSEIGKLMALPEGERPTVATVSDATKVKEQPFFKNAQNGDKVLIYTSTRRVILYRPSEKRIIEVGAVNIRQQSSAAPNASGAAQEETDVLDDVIVASPIPSPTSAASTAPVIAASPSPAASAQ